MYTNQGGSEGNRSRFISKLKDHMNEEIYVFSCPGVASIIMLKQKASHLVKCCFWNRQRWCWFFNACPFKKKKKKSCCPILRMNTTLSITRISWMNAVRHWWLYCQTCLQISKKFIIGNIVASVVTKRFTKLQLAISVLAVDRKLTERLHEYGITSTYQ